MSADYTDEELDVIGKRLAKALKLGRDKDHRDRWATEWGSKTNKGLVLTLIEMVNRIENGEWTTI